MDWNAVLQIVLTAIASVGGAGAIIIAISKWLANITADKIMKQTEIKFSKELEDFKSRLDKKTYISKTRFDLEIEIYRLISGAILQMVFDNNCLFPPGLVYLPADEEERKKQEEDNYKSAVSSYNTANVAITQNAPFIPKEIFDMFVEIKDLCKMQIANFPHYGFKNENTIYDKSAYDGRQKCFDRTMEIDKQMKLIIEKLRKYISDLDVLDNK